MASEKNYQVTLSRISANIKRIRKKQGLSQSDVADLGFDLRAFQRLENGQSSPTVYTVQKVADCLGVDISVLFKAVKKS